MGNKEKVSIFLLICILTVLTFIILGAMFQHYDKKRAFKFDLGIYTEKQQIDLYRANYIGHCYAISDFLSQEVNFAVALNDSSTNNLNIDPNRVYPISRFRKDLKTLSEKRISNIDPKVIDDVLKEEQSRVKIRIVNTFLNSSDSFDDAKKFSSKLINEETACFDYFQEALKDLDIHSAYYKKNRFTF
jgi:hypothetical protein